MPVEVILKKRVPGLGAEADLVKVKPGYARNYLLPRDIATIATSASKRQVEELRRQRAAREASELNAAQELSTKLAKVTLTFQMQSADSENAKVFGSVTAQDIIDRLAALGHVVDKKQLDIPRPLKDIGEHTIAVKLEQGVEGKLTVVLAKVETEAKEEEPKKKGAKGAAAKPAKGSKDKE